MSHISVCMATYNGRPYIEMQLRSILSQIDSDDELIICDDGSTDGTAEFIETLNDPRIRFHRHPRRLGYAGNFERALKLATGDLIFLSDQDDVWQPDKIKRMKEVFDRHPDIAMVHHERLLIDANGLTIRTGAYLGEGLRQGLPLIVREFIKSKLWGCCMGLRAQVVQHMLPFPRSVYGHDHWAILVAALSGGIYLLPEHLIAHRQHARNVTPKYGLTLGRKIWVRIRMMSMIGHAFYRVRLRAPQRAHD